MFSRLFGDRELSINLVTLVQDDERVLETFRRSVFGKQ